MYTFAFGIILISSVVVNSKILRGRHRFSADFTLVEGNQRITRNCIKNFTKKNLRKCIYKCISHASCLTFNHHEGLEICELLNVSKFDQLGLFEFHRGWNHYETDNNQRKIGEICKASDLCKDYETCEDTFNSTRYICKCPDGFNGTKCEQYTGRGSRDGDPASACSLILSKYNLLTDGFYWLKKGNTSHASKKYCRRKEYLTVLKWSPWNDCIYPGSRTGYQIRTRECHDPRAKNRRQRKCEDEYEERSCPPLPASCYEIMNLNPASKSGLYKIYLGQPVTVFCDMETGPGGWMLVVNVTINKDITEGEATKISAARSTNIEELYKAENENLLFDIRTFKSITTFRKLRFYCHKKGKTIHIHTKANPKGREVLDYFLGKTSKQPAGCYSYKVFEDDNSHLSANCRDWHGGKWGFGEGVSYQFPFYIENTSHFGVYQSRFECDEDGKDRSNKGVWRIYIR